MSNNAGASGVECVTQRTLVCSLTAVFFGNAVFTILMLFVPHNTTSATVNNSIQIDSDKDRSRLIEEIARTEDARLHDTTGRLQLGSSH